MRRIAGLVVAVVAGVGLPAQQGGAEGGAPEPSPESIVGEIRFEEGFPTRVMIDLAKEGARPFRMMLDTGAAGSVITPLMARSLGVTVRRVKSSPYRRATRLGRDVHFWIDDRTSDTGSKTGWEYGLLGGDFLDDYVLEIDYPGQRVRFLDPKRYEVPKSVSAEDERVIGFRRSGTRIVVDIEIGGEVGGVVFDTGAPHTFIISGKLAKKMGIDTTPLRDFGEGGTVLGPMDILLFETDTFRFAGFDFPEMAGLVAPKGWYNMVGPNDSVIGYDVLRQFVIRIDYKRRRIWLKRSGDTRTTFQGADYAMAKQIGAFVTPSGDNYWIWGIDPAGPAAALGLREGDIIVAVVGEKRYTSDEVMARILAGEELNVARKQGDVWVDTAVPATEPYTDEADAD